MKIKMEPAVQPRRGGKVEVGNVYSNQHGKNMFKVVVGKAPKPSPSRYSWNNIICLHVNIAGEVIGCSALPEDYVRNHQDLVGKVDEMPELKIQWLKEGDCS